MSVLIEQFVHSLSESGLMPRQEVEAFLSQLGPADTPRTSEEFARLLYKSRKLSKYQAQAVYQGRTKGLVMGNYVVLDKVGQGGMGHVYKARHKRMDRIVALKVLPADVAKESKAVRRFQQEVKAAARLSHQNIVTAHDADVADGIHFLVMEYVDGENLAAAVARQGPFDVDDVIDYVLQAARGREYAHDTGVIHRDVKPSNLLLDKSGVVKVLDMGLAHLEEKVGAESTTASDAVTGIGQMMGTIDYMSPEQSADAHDVDHRTDIYSLGATLFFLLTGRPVYGGSSPATKVLAHREEEIPSLCEACPEAPQMLDDLFRRMLAKRPEDRPTSVAEVISELEVCNAMVRQPGGDDSSIITILTDLGDPAGNGNSSDKDDWLIEELPELPTQFETSRLRPYRSKSNVIGAGPILATAGAVLVIIAAIVILRGNGENRNEVKGDHTPEKRDLPFFVPDAPPDISGAWRFRARSTLSCRN